MSLISIDTPGPPPSPPNDTVSLYLDLIPGQKPDLDVVARASIAFVQAVKEAAYILNPGMEISVELISGTEGSFSLNTFIKSIRRPDPVALKALSLLVLGWFANDIRTFGVVKFLEHYYPPEQRLTLTDDDLQRIVRALKESTDGKIARDPVKQVYRELERDTSIKGVGATRSPGTRPNNIVPRERFPELSQTILLPDAGASKRKKPSKERVTLISPVLLPRDRVWRFYTPQLGEFNASISDQKFVKGIITGRRKIQMRGGIEMNVLMETHEVREGGVWMVKSRDITHVIRVMRPPRHPMLPLLLNEPPDDDE